MVAAFHVAVTDWAPQKMGGEVESVRTASVLTARAHEGALVIVLLRACISVHFEDFCYLIKVEKCREAGCLPQTVFTSLLTAIVIPLIFTNQMLCGFTPSLVGPPTHAPLHNHYTM